VTERLNFQSAGATRKPRERSSEQPRSPTHRQAEAWRLLEKTVAAFGELTDDGDIYIALADLLKRRPHHALCGND
jgi:hypothetical protein